MKKLIALAMGMVLFGGISKAEAESDEAVAVHYSYSLNELSSAQAKELEEAQSVVRTIDHELEGAKDLREIVRLHSKDLKAMMKALQERRTDWNYKSHGITGANKLKENIVEAIKGADAEKICAAMIEQEAAKRVVEAQNMAAVIRQKYSKTSQK